MIEYEYINMEDIRLDCYTCTLYQVVVVVVVYTFMCTPRREDARVVHVYIHV